MTLSTNLISMKDVALRINPLLVTLSGPGRCGTAVGHTRKHRTFSHQKSQVYKDTQKTEIVEREENMSQPERSRQSFLSDPVGQEPRVLPVYS